MNRPNTPEQLQLLVSGTRGRAQAQALGGGQQPCIYALQKIQGLPSEEIDGH